jgi:mannose-6-phosphate isomerase
MECKACLLENCVQHYQWGTKDFIPDLLGKKRDGKPWAELWMGDHPRAESRILKGGSLESIGLGDFIKEDPRGVLGPDNVDRHGSSLPFLFKVLSAAEPLSIQAHPDKEQALSGYEEENRAGVPLDAPHRNYRDRNHKPEIIVALTPFTAMCGFRPVSNIVSYFSALESKSAEALLLPQLKQQDTKKALSDFFSTLLSLPVKDASELITASRRWAEREVETKGDKKTEAELILRFLHIHPEDPAITAPLYLNVLTLRPGEALYQPAGLLHAYVEGTGMELMANSDNVLRGGLTSKYMDLKELEKVLLFKPSAPQLIALSGDGSGIETYHTEAPEFELSRFFGKTADTSDKKRGSIKPGSPAIIFVIEGTLSIETQSGVLSLSRGQSAFISAYCDTEISGKGNAYIATLPNPHSRDHGRGKG